MIDYPRRELTSKLEAGDWNAAHYGNYWKIQCIFHYLHILILSWITAPIFVFAACPYSLVHIRDNKENRFLIESFIQHSLGSVPSAYLLNYPLHSRAKAKHIRPRPIISG